MTHPRPTLHGPPAWADWDGAARSTEASSPGRCHLSTRAPRWSRMPSFNESSTMSPHNRSLELLHEPPRGAARSAPPLLFLHGAFAGAWCWRHFLPWFADAGFDAWALSFSGHGNSERDKPFDALGIGDYVADVCWAAARMPQTPVLIGHSMGGFVAQKALEQRAFPAVLLLASVPPSGLSAALWHQLTHAPRTLIEMNRFLAKRRGDMRLLARALFHHLPEPQALQEFLRASQPESMRALWDMIGFALPSRHRQNPTRWCVVGAEHDQIIPPELVSSTARHYGVAPRWLTQAGHAFMLEPDWPRHAQAILGWLEEIRRDEQARQALPLSLIR